MKHNRVNFTGNIIYYGVPIIENNINSSITIGENVVLCSNSKYTALGISHPVIIRTLRDNSIIIIGNNCGLSGTTICSAISVKIGQECLFGADVQITDTDFHSLSPSNRRFEKDPSKINAAPITIGNNVFIGAGSKILKGAKIGDNAVIGAGSIVTGEIPSDVIAAGIPAKVISKLP